MGLNMLITDRVGRNQRGDCGFRFCYLTSVAIILVSVTRIMCSVFYLAESYDMVLWSIVTCGK
jgi:hypothetical protein